MFDSMRLGYRAKASTEAKRAVELSKTRSQEEQLLIRAQYARTLDGFATKAQIYNSFFFRGIATVWSTAYCSQLLSSTSILPMR